jgi:hypothetical protein
MGVVHNFALLMNHILLTFETIPHDIFFYMLHFVSGDEIKTMCDALPTFLERMEEIKDWDGDYILEIKADITEETAAFFLWHEIHWKQTKVTQYGYRTYLDGHLHSFDDNPAIVETTFPRRSYKKWYKHGRLHRGPHLPANVQLNGNATISLYYYEGGLYCMSGGYIPHPRNLAEMNETRQIMRELNILHLYMN